MNHPIITTGIADARHADFVKAAEQYRLVQSLPKATRTFSLIGALNGRFGRTERKSRQEKLANASA